SSETLEEGLMNVGLFLNYAGNTLAYSKNIAGQAAGRKPGDRILGMDLNFGLGLAKNWDIGVSLPSVLSQELDDTSQVVRYDSRGLTEIRMNTKYRFWGDNEGGVAAVFSINHSLIKDNPFMGEDAGPVLNYELVMDTTLWQKYAVALNVGYRQRDSGRTLSNFPYEPFGNQWIYSVAANYLVQSWDTKIIAEIFGSEPVEKLSYDRDRSQSTLEGLVGMKHDYSPSLALHAGLGSQIQRSVASPEWRVYAGLNYVWGPLWKSSKEKPVEKIEPAPTPEVPVAKASSAYRIRGEILFEFNSAEIKREAYAPLQDLAQELTANGFSALTIEGHTDSLGDETYNQILSQRRADSVKEHLVRVHKLDGAKIKAVGKGESEPIADNGNFQGRRENRRVEFLIEK
ncbi:MAG: OmpA family protein, partial [Bdellovibrio sp.]